MTETLEAKATRLFYAGAVTLGEVLPDGSRLYTVTGDSGSHRVVLDRNAGLCDCRATSARCSHVLAAEIASITRKEPSMHEPDTPDLEPEDAGTEPGIDPVEIELGPVIDYETGEVLGGPGSDQIEVLTRTPAVPAAGPAIANGSGLVDIASAPITWRTLEALSRTEFVPVALRGRPAAVLGAVLLGRDYGLGPLEALRTIDVIDGSPSPNAELLLRLYRRAGHRLEVVEHTSAVCRLKGARGDTGEELEAAFSVEDALAAGLVDSIDDDGRPRARSRKGAVMPWEAFTSDLLWARAVSRLVRRLAPDCLDRVLTP